MSTENPYTAPTDTPLPVETGDERSLMEIAKSTFLAWEKLRIFYIAILAIFCIVCILVVSSVQANTMAGLSHSWVELLFALIGGAVFANVCFFAGPIVETYVCWLGASAGWLRISLFAIGTIFTSVLACLSIVVVITGL